LRQIAESEQVAPTQGLSQPELIVLAVLPGNAGLPGTSTSVYSLKNDAERSGLTAIGFSLAFRRLFSKRFVDVTEEHDETGDSYDAARLTDKAWEWIEQNETLFVLRKKRGQSSMTLKTIFPSSVGHNPLLHPTPASGRG